MPTTHTRPRHNRPRRAGAGRRLTLVLLSIAFGVGGPACHEQVNAEFPTASSLPDGDRRPDAVAVDLRSDPPPEGYVADSEAGIVTLRAPLGRQAAYKVIGGFFDAVVDEEIGGLVQQLDSGAMQRDLRGGSDRRVAVGSLWRQRFMKHVFQELPRQLIYRENDVEIFSAEHRSKLPLAVRYLEPFDLAAEDLLLRVPISLTTVRNMRLFGDEMYFWLRQRGDRYVIYRVAERVPF